LDRTYLRPRDIIKFCNETLKHYKIRNVSGGLVKFENVDLNTARDDYGNYFIEELDDEIHKHVPKYNDYFEIFRTLGTIQFNKVDFIKAFETKKSLFPEIKNPDIILKETFNFSIIGFYRAGGKGYGGSEYVFQYTHPRAQFDENAQEFRLHLGLMDVLELKKYKRT
jgi:hypothetical protein